MPATPVPTDLDTFLRRPHPAVVATVRSDGSPHTAATWYEWDGEQILLNMDEDRVRLRFMQNEPRIAITVLDERNWSRHVSLQGHMVSLLEDAELRDIDRLAERYTGQPFAMRSRRRVSARIEVTSWHAWSGSGPWLSA